MFFLFRWFLMSRNVYTVGLLLLYVFPFFFFSIGMYGVRLHNEVLVYTTLCAAVDDDNKELY